MILLADLLHQFFSEEKNWYVSNSFVVDIGDQNDVPKFHHLLLQSLENLNHFKAFVSTVNSGEFLFAFVLQKKDEEPIWNKYGEAVNSCIECKISTFSKYQIIFLSLCMSFSDFLARLSTSFRVFIYKHSVVILEKSLALFLFSFVVLSH